jgi:NurA-like 5'-3' nuclease
VDLQAVQTSIDVWTENLKDVITDIKKNLHEAIANTRNDLQAELGLMIQGEAQMIKTLLDNTRQRLEAKLAEV